jgi:hypothetical protein
MYLNYIHVYLNTMLTVKQIGTRAFLQHIEPSGLQVWDSLPIACILWFPFTKIKEYTHESQHKLLMKA